MAKQDEGQTELEMSVISMAKRISKLEVELRKAKSGFKGKKEVKVRKRRRSFLKFTRIQNKEQISELMDLELAGKLTFVDGVLTGDNRGRDSLIPDGLSILYVKNQVVYRGNLYNTSPEWEELSYIDFVDWISKDAT